MPAFRAPRLLAGSIETIVRLICIVLFILPLGASSAVESAKPASGTPAPVNETLKWLTTVDGQWRGEFDRNIAKPFDKAIAEIRNPYLAALEAPMTQAMRAGKGDEAAMWRAERERVSSDATAVPADDTNIPPTLKLLRRSYRVQVNRIVKDRADHAQSLFTRCDEQLTRKEQDAKMHQRLEDIAAIGKEREQLRADWLPAGAAVTTTAQIPLDGPVAARLPAKEALAKLIELGADVAVRPPGGQVEEIKPDAPPVYGKFSFVRVQFRPQKPDESPMTAADYDILDSLSEVEQLGLAGPVVKDAVMEKLHAFHALRSLTLNRVRPATAGYSVLAKLPALRELQLVDTEVTPEDMAVIMQCRKLQGLDLASLSLKDDGFVDIGKLSELNHLQLNSLGNITSKAFGPLVDCRSLKSVYAGGFIILSGMVEHLGHCKNLQTISLPNTVLKDDEVAPLGTLEKLQSLDLSRSSVTGTVFGQWKVHKLFTSLNLGGAKGVNDTACQGIEKAFPKLQSLDVNIAPSGFSKVGATALGRLRELRSLNVGGVGVNDEIIDQLTHAPNITSLSIPSAVLTEPGMAAIGRLQHLTNLNIDIPPITDDAVKAFARCKQLKTMNIGKDAHPDTEYKLESAVPGLIIHRPED